MQKAMDAMTDRQKSSRAVVVEWIDHIREMKKWSGTDLARHSDLAPSTVLRLLHDPKHRFVPTLRTLQKIADGSGFPIPRKVTDALEAPRIEPAAETESTASPTSRRMKSGAVSDFSHPRATVEVRRVSSLPSALQAASGRAEVSVATPPQLEGDDTAFAFYAPDNTMDPYIKVGTLDVCQQATRPLGRRLHPGLRPHRTFSRKAADRYQRDGSAHDQTEPAARV